MNPELPQFPRELDRQKRIEISDEVRALRERERRTQNEALERSKRHSQVSGGLSPKTAELFAKARRLHQEARVTLQARKQELPSEQLKKFGQDLYSEAPKQALAELKPVTEAELKLAEFQIERLTSLKIRDASPDNFTEYMEQLPDSIDVLLRAALTDDSYFYDTLELVQDAFEVACRIDEFTKFKGTVTSSGASLPQHAIDSIGPRLLAIDRAMDGEIDVEKEDLFIKLLDKACSDGSPFMREKAKLVFQKHCDSIFQYAKAVMPASGCAFGRMMVQFGTEAQRWQLFQLFDHGLREGTGRHLDNWLYYLCDFCGGEEVELHKFGDPLLVRFLERYHLSEKTIYAWRQSAHAGEAREVLVRNLTVLERLEETRPGITAVLAKEFGIYDFARYPRDLLVDQYDNREQAQRPYGIVMFPRSDHNGAFYDDKYILELLHMRIKDRYDLRVVECEGVFDVAKKLLALDRRYGEKQKISFAIIGGHGESDGIRFGGILPRHRLALEHLNKSGSGRAKGTFFTEKPKIILVSCSTGVKGGIAERLSTIMPGAKLIAPDRPTSLKAIEAKITSDDIDFDVEYSKKDESKVFIGGQEKK